MYSHASSISGHLVKFILNLFLISEKVDHVHWLRSDKRSVHLTEVLKAGKGSVLDFAVENGPKGKGTVEYLDEHEIVISCKWHETNDSDLLPVSLIVGLSRPQTCRKILEQATTLGVRCLHFFSARKGEPSYASSRLWITNEWKSRIRNGAEQAFSSQLPDCKIHPSLDSLLQDIPIKDEPRVAFDNYEADRAFKKVFPLSETNNWLAFGPERGWSAEERKLLTNEGFTLCSLGKRVLRVETAVVSAVGTLSNLI